MAKEKFVAGMYLKITFFLLYDGDDLLCSTLLISLQQIELSAQIVLIAMYSCVLI
jgi:hypothetical protein